MSFEPIKLLREANKNYPETKYLWIVLAIAACAVIVKSFALSNEDLIIAAVFFGGCILIFALTLTLSQIIRRGGIYGAKILATIIVWSIPLILVATAGFAAVRYVVLEDRSFLFSLVRGKPEIEKTVESISIRPEAVEQSNTIRSVGESASSSDDCLETVDRSLSINDFKKGVEECLNSKDLEE